jgi:tRNA dimethylallyltransferase
MKKLELIHKLNKFLETAKTPLVIITGPTACGKTALSIELCKQFNGQVINADSRQIYTDMPIGSELITEKEMQGVPHHLFGIRSPLEPMTVAEYKELVEKKIDEIHMKMKISSHSESTIQNSKFKIQNSSIPFLVGGSVMWIDAVVNNYQFPKKAFDEALRKQIDKMSVDEMLKQLLNLDPASHRSLARERNPRYIGRALEIVKLTGKPKSAYLNGQKKYDVFKIAIDRPREELYETINQRVYSQLERGLVSEVETLVKKYNLVGAKNFLPLPVACQSIGCKEVIPYLSGKISKQQMISELQQGSRNYAKRQLTWLKKDKALHWLKVHQKIEHE